MTGNIDIPYAEEILEQRNALEASQPGAEYRISEKRSLPTPVWARRGLPDDGQLAWQSVQRQIENTGIQQPFCIYLHVPFCSTHCQFCDCYAFALKRNIEKNVSNYSEALMHEMHRWASIKQLVSRPVSTVHFGGGTPLFLGKDCFSRVVQNLRDLFSLSIETELAIECTSSSLNDETFELLNSLGFRRLHIGIQTLDDAIRQEIGRRENAGAVLQKIKRAISYDWIVSVDMIAGLPGQTCLGLLDDVDALIDSGVEGFSIYELQKSSQNRCFIDGYSDYDQDVERRYLLFQMAFQHLLSNGFSMNVFNHLARGRDKNLYFTYPERNEDLLALGTIADGVFGDYHYRHPTYRSYLTQAGGKNPGLQGGIRHNQKESLYHRLEIEMMRGTVSERSFIEILGRKNTISIFKAWEEKRLVTQKPGSENYRLTPNGAWFIGRMLQEIYEIINSQESVADFG